MVGSAVMAATQPYCDSATQFLCVGLVSQNGLFEPFVYIYIYKRTFYQDRLGTNIGKALKKGPFFLRLGRCGHSAKPMPTLFCFAPNPAVLFLSVLFSNFPLAFNLSSARRLGKS
jgi:hypothetical protein